VKYCGLGEKTIRTWKKQVRWGLGKSVETCKGQPSMKAREKMKNKEKKKNCRKRESNRTKKDGGK